ncbi:hypothetical protein ACLKA6_020020 [Drosophila palustris]
MKPESGTESVSCGSIQATSPHIPVVAFAVVWLASGAPGTSSAGGARYGKRNYFEGSCRDCATADGSLDQILQVNGGVAGIVPQLTGIFASSKYYRLMGESCRDCASADGNFASSKCYWLVGNLR